MSFDKHDVKIESSEVIYAGHINLKELILNIKYFNGTTSSNFSRELAYRSPVAAVIPYDVRRNKVVLIEQFRVGALADEKSPWLLEFVAGILDKEGESRKDMAKRELEEEAGLKVKDLSFIMKYWVSPGATDEQVYLYWADVDSSSAGKYCGVHSEFEDIKVHVVSLEEAIDMMEKGKICNSLAIIGLQWLQINRNNLKKK